MTYTFSQAEYNAAKHKVDTYNAAVKEWLTAHKTNGIPVEIAESMPYGKEVTNTMRSQIEVYEFRNNPPEKYFLYIDEKNQTATTNKSDSIYSPRCTEVNPSHATQWASIKHLIGN